MSCSAASTATPPAITRRLSSRSGWDRRLRATPGHIGAIAVSSSASSVCAETAEVQCADLTLPSWDVQQVGCYLRYTVVTSTESRRQPLPSRPGEFHPEPLSGRVEDWRAGLGRSLYSLFLALSFASVTLSRPCHVSSPR